MWLQLGSDQKGKVYTCVYSILYLCNNHDIINIVQDYAATIFSFIYPSKGAALLNSNWNYMFILPQFCR